MCEDSFGKLNPIVVFLYFFVVFASTMLLFNIFVTLIALIFGVAYGLKLSGSKMLLFNLKVLLPVFLVTTAINPLFNHRGVTILFYLNNGNPITLESIYCGVGAGLMFISVIAWFNCYNKIMTSDKFIYVFGRIIPSLSLVISMILRFVPLFNQQRKKIYNAQLAMGAKKATLWQKINISAVTMNILLTWGLENAVDTADSMRSRGYGLKGRTSFAIYKFDTRDKIVSTILALLLAILLYSVAKGSFTMRYYPSFYMADINIASYIFYAVLVGFPIIMDFFVENR